MAQMKAVPPVVYRVSIDAGIKEAAHTLSSQFPGKPILLWPDNVPFTSNSMEQAVVIQVCSPEKSR